MAGLETIGTIRLTKKSSLCQPWLRLRNFHVYYKLKLFALQWMMMWGVLRQTTSYIPAMYQVYMAETR